MDQWEQRDRKLQARRERIAKHGRSLLTTIPAAERKRAAALEQRARQRAARMGRKKANG